jgi:cell division septal protein FtsQ
MAKKRIIGRLLIIFFLIVLIFAGIIMIFNKSIFLIKHVVVNKDFNLDDSEIIDYLKIYPLRSIFSYDKYSLENNLMNLGFIEKAEVKKILPDTLSIKLKHRVPVAMINCADGNLFSIDKNGIIYNDIVKSKYLVVITFDKQEKLNPGMILKEKYKKICSVLNEIKNSDQNLYSSISQIDVLTRDDLLEYFVRFNAKSTIIYLKNQINVDFIRKGLLSVLYLKDKADGRVLILTDQGFAYD